MNIQKITKVDISYCDYKGGDIMPLYLRNAGIAGFCLLVLVVFCLFVNAFFVHKEIMSASNTCYNTGGNPTVIKDRFALDWSFSCDYGR